MNSLDWDDLRVFLALARGGSVRRAGALLGVHHSTVARRLDALEGRMGVTLFTRRSRGLALSTAGEDLLEAAERVEAEMVGIERRLLGHDQRISGRVRLTLPDAVATGFLLDGLAEFLGANPDLELDLIASSEVLDLGRGEADVAIRITEAPPEHLVGRPLGRVALTAWASPAYLSRVDPVRQPRAARLLGWSSDQANRNSTRDVGLPEISAWGAFPSVLLQQSAAAAGLGIALLPTMLGEADPRLVPVPGARVIAGPMAWLLTHPELRRSARVVALMRAVTAAFEQRGEAFTAGLEGVLPPGAAVQPVAAHA